jgi:hypothetical protein
MFYVIQLPSLMSHKESIPSLTEYTPNWILFFVHVTQSQIPGDTHSKGGSIQERWYCRLQPFPSQDLLPNKQNNGFRSLRTMHVGMSLKTFVSYLQHAIKDVDTEQEADI